MPKKEKKKSITKAEFLSKLSHKCNITAKQAGEFYSAILNVIQDELKENEFIKLPDFIKVSTVLMPEVPEQKKFSHLHNKEIIVKHKPKRYVVKIGSSTAVQKLAPSI